MRSRILKLLFAPAVIVAAACGGKDDAVALDAGLSNDLALAAQVQPYQPQQFVSPMEQGYGPQYGYGQPYPVQQYPVAARYPQQQPVYAGPAPVRRVPTASRGTGTASTGTVAREPVRHTKRDAIIGAAAGAVLGQAVGRNTKSTVIGAAAGAVLGGIIGHTVDVEHR
jgi:uncharacterized protein YcfJ